MDDKKEARLERKKKKIKAFLEVAKLNDDDKTKPMVDFSPSPSHLPKIAAAATIAKKKTFRPMDNDELQKLKAELRKRQNKAMESPKVYITLDWVALSCDVCPMDLTRVQVNKTTFVDDDVSPPLQYYQPLFPVDLQHLILYAIEGNTTPYKPRWCKLLRHSKVTQIVVLEMPNVTKETFLSSQHCLPFLKELGFDMCTEVISPAMYGSSFLVDIMDVAISRRKMTGWEKTHGISYAQSLEFSQSIAEHLRIPEMNPEFSRLSLLLSTQQLVFEGFLLPVDLDHCLDYVYSQEKYNNVSAKSPMFALDCEMCMTTKKKLELTRIAVVNEKFETVYETLVKPYNHIVDYVTRYSGVTKKMLANVSTRLDDVQAALQKLLPPDAILCGQSLSGDLRAIKMFHPYVIDTSVIFNLTGVRRMKPGLKILSAHFLGKSIQDSSSGHNPVEDATATMELVLLKLKEGLSFGDAVLGGSMVLAEDDPKQTDAVSGSDTEKNMEKSTKLDIQIKTEDDDDDDDGDDDEPPQKKIKSELPPISQDQESSSDVDDEYKEQDEEDIRRKSSLDIKGRPDPGNVTNQQKIFFQKLGSGEKQNFFSITQSYQRKVCLIGPESTVQSWKATPEAETVNFIVSESNKSCRKACQSAVQEDNFLVWAQFDDSIEQEEEHMKQIDRWVKKVTKKCKTNTLLMVLLAGQPIPSSHCNAVCLTKIM